jgi:hypothetical protein
VLRDQTRGTVQIFCLKDKHSAVGPANDALRLRVVRAGRRKSALSLAADGRAERLVHTVD